MIAHVKAVLLVVACLLLPLVAWRVHRRWREEPATGTERAVALLGAGVGLAFAVVVYPFDQRTRILGFPFPGAFLQLSNSGVWQDFLGITTVPFLCVDAAIGAVLGHGAI